MLPKRFFEIELSKGCFVFMSADFMSVKEYKSISDFFNKERSKGLWIKFPFGIFFRYRFGSRGVILGAGTWKQNLHQHELQFV